MDTSIPINILGYVEKIMLSSKFNCDMLNVNAIFSDETPCYRYPEEPSDDEKVTVKIRTGRDNIDMVLINYDDIIIEMKKSYSEGIFDFYSIDIKPECDTKKYYFEIVKDNVKVYYSKKGITRCVEEVSYFNIIRNFMTPKWSKGAVMYQIYTDRFYNGDKTNDVIDNEYIYLGKPSVFIKDWDKTPSQDDIRNFYGGDLKGVIDKMDYLNDLGIDVIYFNPLFVSPSNHKYDIQDYDYIDPHFGVIVEDGGSPLVFEKFNNRYATMYIQRTTDTKNLEASNSLFIKLVEIAHERNIKVILDGVFNHCGAFNKWLDREGFYNSTGKYPDGAYKSKSSKYHDYFRWYENDNWPNNDCYDGWWGYDNHPKLNFEASKELYNYILEVGKKWVSPPFNADGWRLDVAADLGYSEVFNHKFWKDFRKSVKTANPEAIILAEHYGDANSWLKGDEWDTIMNYDAFMEPLSWFLTGMEKHSENYREDLLCNGKAFVWTMIENMSKLSIQSIQTSMNELSNHDHSRFLTRTNKTVGRLHTLGAEAAQKNINKAVLHEAVVFQMTWPGSPTIYYGDEAGVCGWTDPDNRRTYPWGKEDTELIEFHKEIIKIHKSSDLFKTGSVKFLYSDYGIISYGRFNDNEKVVVILNNNNFEKEINVPVWQSGIKLKSNLSKIISTGVNGFNMDTEIFNVIDGVLKIKMSAFSSIVLSV